MLVRNKRNKGVVVAVGRPYLQRGRSFRRQETSKRQRSFRKMYSSKSQCYVKFTVSPQACRKCADNICVQAQLKVQVSTPTGYLILTGYWQGKGSVSEVLQVT